MINVRERIRELHHKRPDLLPEELASMVAKEVPRNEVYAVLAGALVPIAVTVIGQDARARGYGKPVPPDWSQQTDDGATPAEPARAPSPSDQSHDSPHVNAICEQAQSRWAHRLDHNQLFVGGAGGDRRYVVLRWATYEHLIFNGENKIQHGWHSIRQGERNLRLAEQLKAHDVKHVGDLPDEVLDDYFGVETPEDDDEGGAAE